MSLLEPQHIAIIAPNGGDDPGALKTTINSLSLPGAVIQTCVEGETAPANPAMVDKRSVEGKPTAYVCIGPQCSLPVTSGDALDDLLRAARKGDLLPPA